MIFRISYGYSMHNNFLLQLCCIPHHPTCHHLLKIIFLWLFKLIEPVWTYHFAQTVISSNSVPKFAVDETSCRYMLLVVCLHTISFRWTSLPKFIGPGIEKNPTREWNLTLLVIDVTRYIQHTWQRWQYAPLRLVTSISIIIQKSTIKTLSFHSIETTKHSFSERSVWSLLWCDVDLRSSSFYRYKGSRVRGYVNLQSFTLNYFFENLRTSSLRSLNSSSLELLRSRTIYH